MILFSSPTCEKCKIVKENFDLKNIGVRVEELTEENDEGLALLAWYELVKKAEEGLPILHDEKQGITLQGEENISKYLQRIERNINKN